MAIQANRRLHMPAMFSRPSKPPPPDADARVLQVVDVLGGSASRERIIQVCLAGLLTLVVVLFACFVVRFWKTLIGAWRQRYPRCCRRNNMFS